MNKISRARVELGRKHKRVPELDLENLRAKLIEETQKVAAATESKQITEELGDALHTISLICDVLGIELVDIEQKALNKFNMRCMLVDRALSRDGNKSFMEAWNDTRNGGF